MSERYIKQFLLPENLHAAGSPVLIAAGALLKDDQTGRLLAQLKLRSISPKPIRTVTVAVTPQYPDGRAAERESEWTYSAEDVARDADFGQKAPVFLTDGDAFAFSARVDTVVFVDGSVWKNTQASWMPLLSLQTLEPALGSEEAAEHYRVVHGKQCVYMPEERQGLWYCACGGLNLSEETSCHICGLELDGLRAASAEKLAQAAQAKLTAKAQQAKKRIKFIGLGAAALVVAVIAGILISGAVRRNTAYKDALALLEQGQYSMAEAAFTELGDYKDSAELLADIPYREATILLNEGRLDEAREAFLALGDYKDSAQIAEDIPYQQAILLLEGGKLNEARQAFSALGDYKESKTYLADIPYLEAQDLLAGGKLDEAREAFLALGNYKDSAEIAEDIPYQKAVRFMEQKSYQEALDIFQTLGNYKDSKEQAVLATQALCDHVYGSEVTKEPNCTETGIRLFTCSKCDHAYEEDIPIEHKYSSSVTRQPTCSRVGEKTTVCSACGDTVLSDIAMLPHSWNAATCTTPKTCTTCKRTEGSPLPHNYAAATCVVLKTCVDCGATTGSLAPHNYAPATCEEPMTCRVCQATTGSPRGHNWREATCSKPKTCRTCGKTEGGTLPHDFYSGSKYVGICRACDAMDFDWQDHVSVNYSSEVVNGFQITGFHFDNVRTSYSWVEYDLVVYIQKVEETDATSVRVSSSGDYFSGRARSVSSMSVGESVSVQDDGYCYGDRSYYLTLSAY